MALNLKNFLSENSDSNLSKLMEKAPDHIKDSYRIRKFEKGSVIQRKDDPLKEVSIICEGTVRLVNEFENGNICVIEENDAIDFIGEVTALAGKQSTSVTIEAMTDCMIVRLSLEDFFEWLKSDNDFLLLIAKKLAGKLYASSYAKGLELFYPARYLVSKFIVDYVKTDLQHKSYVTISLTRETMSENIGITVRTVNRIVKELKEENYISVVKGKIRITREQYLRMADYVITNISCNPK